MNSEKERSLKTAIVRGLKISGSGDVACDYLCVYCWGDAPGSVFQQDSVVTDSHGHYLLCKNVQNVPQLWAQAGDIYRGYIEPTSEVVDELDIRALSHRIRYSRKYFSDEDWDCVAFLLDAIRSKTCAMFDRRDEDVLGELLVYSLEVGGIHGFFSQGRCHTRKEVLRAVNATIGGFLLNAQVID